MKAVWVVAFKEGDALVLLPVEAETEDKAVETAMLRMEGDSRDRKWVAVWFVCDKRGDSVGEMVVKGLSVGLRIAEKVSWLL